MSTRPKLQDVADLANVSIGTASQALNNKASVLPETRARVLQAARELGYELPIRTILSGKNLSTLGVLIKVHTAQGVLIDPFYAAVLSGAEQECKRHNISLIYASLPVDENLNVADWPPPVSDQQVDGWLIMGTLLPKTVIELEQYLQQPAVLIDAHAPDSECDVIATDDLTGAYEAVTYLINRGHRRIGLISATPDGHPSIIARRQGYLNALADHGIENTYVEESLLRRDHAYEAAQRLLKREPKITGIFACDDGTAVAAMRAAYDLGLRIPDDLSVVGFGDLSLASEIIPSLTTVFVDKLLMGAWGVRQLVERSKNPERVPCTIVLGTQIVERQSVRTINDSG